MRAWLLTYAVTCSVEAFSPSPLASLKRTATAIKVATLEPVVTDSKAPTTWECDEEAHCVEVPACNEEACRTSLDVRIHGNWYDLTGKRETKFDQFIV